MKETYNIFLLNLIKLKMISLSLSLSLSPVILNDVSQFGKNSAYELKSGNHLQRANIQTMHFDSESTKTLGAKIWHVIPAEIKASKSFIIFKKKIKNWTPESCPCRFCRIYIGQVGFIN